MSPARCTKRKRGLQASPQRRPLTSRSQPKNLQGHGQRGARAERHAGCTPAGKRPPWNSSTAVPATFEKFCTEQNKRKRALVKATRKTKQGAEAGLKMDPKGEGDFPYTSGTASLWTRGLAALKLLDFSFLFKPAYFFYECSYPDGESQACPKKKPRMT
ncbi:uncharacterized protein [Dermacentor albipictus]|uniref:uncharacterized protein n=1 Tax=Dermacentor albipictus TaxID=60249 RepID=UPI0031FC95E8